MENTDKSVKITEKRQKLDAPENLIFRTVLEKSLYGTVIVDLQGNIIYLNNYFAEIHGYTTDELTGKNLSVFHSQEQLPCVKKLNEKLIRDGGYEHEEVWHIHKDGTKFLMLMTGLVIHGQDGEPEFLAASAIDITDRKNAQLTLSENEQRYRLLHEHSALAVGYYKPDGTVISFNEKAAQNMGGRPEDFKGKSIFELFPQEDANEYMRRIKTALQIQGTQSYEDNITIADKNFWFKSTYADIRNIDNEIIGIQIISEDISERKEQEEKLIESENHFRNIFEDHNAIMLWVDPEDGRIENTNVSARKFYGYTGEEFSKLTIFDLNQLPKTEVTQKMNYAKKHQTNRFQFKHILKNGEVKDVEVHSTPNTINGRNFLFSIVTDITEQKRSEQIQNVIHEITRVTNFNLSVRDFIRKVHQSISTIFYAKNLFVALYHKDTDKYTFPYFEDETENWESDEAISLKGSLTDFVRRTGKGQLINHLNEAELRSKNEISLVGNDCPIWLGAPLFNTATNEVLGVIAVQDYKNVDAYSRKDLEILEIVASNVGLFIERIQKNDDLEKAKFKAEESDRLKTAFLANMSHEIRTPMSGIMGFAELLKEPSLSGDQQKKYLDVILKSAERMLNTVNDIIDISKIEAGEVELKLSDANIREQVEFLRSFFKPEMAAKGLECICNIPDDPDLGLIVTDHDKLQAILTNLLKNAVKYTPSGFIEFGYSMKGNMVRFEVKDTGIGIPDDRKEAIFDRFVQADIEDRKAMEGSGLGLAISRAYTEMLDGKIWVESNEKGGSTFILEIPDQSQEGMPIEKTNVIPATHDPKPASLQDAVILIAEDEETSDMYMTEILKNECREILHVITGTEAVEIMRTHPEISIVLMDIKMPEMSGYEATRQIRKFNKDVIIIAQTAYALAGDREKSIEAGCDDYLAKPVPKEHLLSAIKNQMNK